MDKNIQRGYILLADISGFDAYITKVELDHAKGVVKELLELIVNRLTPPMRLASLEGDGVLTYAEDKSISKDQSIIELVEATYAEFRDRLASIERNNSCECQACEDAPSLDLKFFMHFGEYSVQAGDGSAVELGGLDANLVRDRLLKDQVDSTKGDKAFILFTEDCIDQMKIGTMEMEANTGTYPYLGEVRTRRLDLRSRYEEMLKARRTFVSPENATFTQSFEFKVPPSILWGWLNEPEKRSLWLKWRQVSAGKRPWGRNGVGAENHCAHGLGTINETILAWNPYRCFTVQSRQDSLKFSMLQTFQLEPKTDGESTRLHIHSEIIKAGPFKFSRRFFNKGLERLWNKDYQLLDNLLAADGLKLEQRVIYP